jgi:NTP pyrophosphatase (non-canonical NTP hydrolase)
MYSFTEYSADASGTATYPNLGENLVYPAMGLVGEAGEVCDKVKKIWRNQGTMSGQELNSLDREKILLEMGDVLWYLDAMCAEMGITLQTVARLNIEKLKDRWARGVIKSEGDSR